MQSKLHLKYTHCLQESAVFEKCSLSLENEIIQLTWILYLAFNYNNYKFIADVKVDGEMILYVLLDIEFV